MGAFAIMRKLTFLRETENEILEASTWYEERGKGLGAEFLRAFEASLAAVERNPFQYAAVHREVRRAPLRRFPYTIMYTVSEGEVLVIACFHAKRDPAHWHERVR